MAWKISVDDKSIMLDDLTPDDFVQATKKYEDVSWLRLYASPGAHPEAMYDLIALCAKKLERPAPPKPKTVKESVQLLTAHLASVDDDLPTEFAEGGIPLEDQAEEETTTSSTSIAPEDGTPTEQEPQA